MQNENSEKIFFAFKNGIVTMLFTEEIKIKNIKASLGMIFALTIGKAH